MQSSVITATFIVYLVVVLTIGIVAWRRTQNLSDYILGGRSLGKWVTALSAQASDMSGWLLLGLPGLAYAAGFQAGWMVIGLLVGTYLNWKIVAQRLRQATEKYGDSLTLPDYFERRFADDSGVLRIISAIFILVFFTFYTSSGLVAGGTLFESVFGLNYIWAVATGGAAVVIYTFAGGFLAVSWTDFLQGMLMFVALILVTVMGLVVVGGFDGLASSMQSVNPELLDITTNADGDPIGIIAILSLLGWGLGYFGQPHVLARFMAIKNDSDIPKARRIAMGWVTIALACATIIGFVGIGHLDQPLVGKESERVFIELASRFFTPVVAGICLAGILAAVMSTADSQLLVASSAVSEDFYKGIYKKHASSKELLWVGRIAVIAIAFVAFLFALNPENKVLDLVAYAWAGFGASFGPTIIFSLYWPALNRNGAIAGILSGGLTVILWKQLSGGIFELYELVPGAIVSVIALVIATRVTSKKTD